jgi:hypothetical protein
VQETVLEITVAPSTAVSTTAVTYISSIRLLLFLTFVEVTDCYVHNDAFSENDDESAAYQP